MKVIQKHSPSAITKIELEQLTGKVVACDTSMAIYQFLVATQTFARKGVPGHHELKDRSGQLTGHLVGLFYRTVQYKEAGIKPVWVFDGTPPQMKASELKKRKESKQQAEQEK